MNHARTSHHRLAASIAAVLVATAAPLAAPAVAMAAVPGAGPVAADTTTDGVPAHFPAKGVLIGAGPLGFATGEAGSPKATYRWTRYSDGATTVFPAPIGLAAGTDTVRMVEGTTHKLYDMSTGAAPVVFDMSGPRATYTRGVTTRSAIAMTAPSSTGGTDLHLLDSPDGTVRDRTVPGFPSDATLSTVALAAPDTLLVQYSGTVDGTTHHRVALVDVTSGAITRDREAPAAGTLTGLTVSHTHLAWVEKSVTDALTIAVARWDDAPGSEPERIAVGSGEELVLDLVGDWVTYAVPDGLESISPNPLFSLTARSLRTGETVPLLDHVISSKNGPGDSQVVRGGSVTENEGLYRVSIGDSGKPQTTLLASTGEPTAPTIVSTDIPDVIDLSKTGGTAALRWSVNRWSLDSFIGLTHVASGRTWWVDRPHGSRDHQVDWDGTFKWGGAAFNGEYTWRIVARPENRIGPATERTGRFTLRNAPAPHDYSDSGSPDLLSVDGAGRLQQYDVREIFGTSTWYAQSTRIGTGWEIYDRVVAPGNLGGAQHADVIARDRNGGLWLYPGAGHSLAPRIKVGTGWQTYDKIAGGSDVNADGRPDLLATDRTGGLWLYPGTGNVNTPLGARKKIGTGWGVYNRITATGNIAGAPAGDLVARDKDGVLWQYLAKGDGTFAPRTRLGGGWNAYTALVGIGDANRDGLNDLIAYGPDNTVHLYPGTGDWRAPFGARLSSNAMTETGASNPVF